MRFTEELLVKPGKSVKLDDYDPDSTPGPYEKATAAAQLDDNTRKLAELQNRLYAAKSYAVLIILQALDAGGKDGTIRHVFGGINPQGCCVTSFKVPNTEEAEHDYLWRIHKAMPARGMLGIFNRSQYEEVLTVRVHDLVPKSVWSQRYEQINNFEKYLAANNVIIRKFFLHISKDEQLKRLDERMENPAKRWKYNPGDMTERMHWDDYMAAYEEVLSRCSHSWAPWFVIPANRNWYRNLVVSSIVLETLEALDLQYPETSA